MPRKPTKSREQKTAESFFPVEFDDVKYAVEKKYSKPDLKSLEKVEKTAEKISNAGGTKTSKKTKTKKIKTKEFRPKKITLKPAGYELIITEKPQAAAKIAVALGKSVKKNIGNVPYYEVTRQGKKIVVACAVGHLFTLAQKDKTGGTSMPVFDLIWVPNFFMRKGDFSKKYYGVLSKLVQGAGSITVATDYDTEGEVIGLNVIRFIANQEDASRMKFSTLTERELNDSYETKKPNLDWGQAIAGETRHYLDWFYGINLSRLLMNAIKQAGNFRVMSIGRVQGPALNLIVKKERQISSFKVKPYWQVFIRVEGHDLEFIYNKDIFNKEELKKFEGIIGKTGTAETKKTQQILSPMPPFNLTALQMEAYRLYKINPGKTLSAAQNLYLSGLISYPRTSSQKLPPSVNYREILKSLAKKYNAEKLLTRDWPVQGKKSDPAHPSIYPTGQDGTKLFGDEKKIYDLIARRFLCLFAEDAVIENKTIKIDIDKLIFSKKGSSVKKSSWLSIYPTPIREKEIPDINGEVKVVNLRTEEKMTQPPHRYSPASLVSELEKRNLGTKATRSNIIETLYQRDYIKDQSIKATPLGTSLISTLEKNSPVIIDEALTRVFEREMEAISAAKKNHEEKKKKIIAEAKSTITKIFKQFKKNDVKIGKELIEGNLGLRQLQKEENKLNICPACKKGSLQILYSKKTRRYFIACNAYPDCKNTYSLPPNSLIKKADKICDECGWPKLVSIRRGRRPWIFCFNPDCETNRERIEKYRKRQKEENNNI